MRALVPLVLVLAALPLVPDADAARIACTTLRDTEPCDGLVCTTWDHRQQRYTRCVDDPFIVCVTEPCGPHLPNPEDWLP